MFYTGIRITIRFWAVPTGQHLPHSGCQWIPNSGTSEIQYSPMVFEGPPRGIRLGSLGPLRAGEGLVEHLTINLFIFTRFLKGFRRIVRF